jgi:hypothetical protein
VKAGKDSVVAVTTDNAAACKLARRLLINKPGFGHILEFRCACLHTCGVRAQYFECWRVWHCCVC